MTVFELDTTLEEMKLYPTNRDTILNRFYSDGAYSSKYDYVTREVTKVFKEEIIFTDLPETADMYHSNYLEYLSDTHRSHRKIVLTPDIVWYTILCEIAKYVKAFPEEHRSLFTKHPGKTEIIVPCSDEYEPLRMDDIYHAMKDFIPSSTHAFFPKFTTTTENSRMACMGAFLETLSPYYSYGMLLCGHISIRVEGTIEDWDKLFDSLNELIVIFNEVESELASFMTFTVTPIILSIKNALKKKDSSYFKEMFTQKKCGSGHEVLVDGWFANLFKDQPSMKKPENYSSHITVVPYFTLPSNSQWNMVFALTHSNRDKDGFMVPQFSRAQVLKLLEPKFVKIPREPFEVKEVKVADNASGTALKANWKIVQAPMESYFLAPFIPQNLKD